MTRMRLQLAVLVTLSILLLGCQGGDNMEAVKDLDLDRFMGDWHVIANIPTFIEKNTTNNLESYSLRDDGNVDITFTVTTEAGERKSYSATGFVLDQNQPSRWRVQFFWPVKFPFYVIELDEEYSYTVIGLPNRKYVWVMAREPQMDPVIYQDILARLSDIGYNVDDIQKVTIDPETIRG